MSEAHWQLYSWDEIDGEIRVIEPSTPVDKSWRYVMTMRNGVREFRSERNHLALTTYAPSRSRAIDLFLKHPEFFH